MGKRTTHGGYIRQRGNAANSARPAQGGPTPGVSLLVTPLFSFDPTQANTTEVPGIVLPKGAVPLFTRIFSAGATGGSSPTVDIGLGGDVADVDGLAAEADADTASASLLTTGSALGTPLDADTPVTAGVGASAATGGAVTARVFYFMNDDGSLSD